MEGIALSLRLKCAFKILTLSLKEMKLIIVISTILEKLIYILISYTIVSCDWNILELYEFLRSMSRNLQSKILQYRHIKTYHKILVLHNVADKISTNCHLQNVPAWLQKTMMGSFLLLFLFRFYLCISY